MGCRGPCTRKGHFLFIHLRVCVLIAVLFVNVVGVGILSCSAEDAVNPSYLVVELIPAESAATRPLATRVQVSSATSVLTTLCLNINAINAPQGVAASFVLQREASKPASERVTLEVTAFDTLSGQQTVAVGKEFACPPVLPNPLGPPQLLDVNFCPGESRRVVIHVGAVCDCNGGMDGGIDADTDADTDAGVDAGPGAGCPCEADETCGAGLTSAGQDCGATECCKRSVSSACALDTPR